MNKSMWIALALSVGLLAWVLTGPGRTTGEVAQKEQVPLMKVQVAEEVARPVDLKIKMQGELLPARSVVLRAETHGRVASIEVDKAQKVEAGQVLISIAMDDRKARLEGAKAELLKAESDLEANRKLFKRGLLSSSQLKQDEANYASAKATLSQIKTEIDHTRVKAPFNGVVDDRYVEVGDYLKSGDDLASILDISTLKMIGWVPQQKAASLSVGQQVETQLVNGKTLSGSISYIAPQANTETRAFKVEVTIRPKEKVKLLGSSVSAEITTERVSAHFVSPSVISLGTDGSLLVKAVNEASRVESYTVEVLQSEASGLWISGLPERVRIITVGQGFVVTGQEVNASFDTSEIGEATSVSEVSTQSSTDKYAAQEV